MAKLIIERKKQYLWARQKIRVLIDGQEVAAMSNGEIKTVEVSDGVHKLKCISGQLIKYPSPESSFSIAAGEKKDLLVQYSPTFTGLYFVLLMAIIITSNVLKEQMKWPPLYLFLSILIPGMIVVLGLRKKFVEVKMG